MLRYVVDHTRRSVGDGVTDDEYADVVTRRAVLGRKNTQNAAEMNCLAHHNALILLLERVSTIELSQFWVVHAFLGRRHARYVETWES